MRLNVELLIGIYMAVCVSVLAFNCAYICADRYRNKREKRPGREMEILQKQFEIVHVKGDLPEKNHAGLKRRLAFSARLEKFHRCMEILMVKEPDLSREYLRCTEEDFQYLTGIYLKKNDMEKAYFARLVQIYGFGKGKGYDGLKKSFVEMTKSSSVYCRENALKALYGMGNTEAVWRAYETMSRSGVVHYEKLLTDGLLGFAGDKKKLAGELWDHRQEFADGYVLAIMRFIRMSQDGYGEVFLGILREEGQNREMRMEAICYFRKYYYEPAYSVLLSIVRNRSQMDWEYAAMAVLSLGNYPGKHSIVVLKSALSSSNWYIRYNAADVLTGRFGLSYLDISDIYNGRDRYAREILTYMMQRYGLKGGGGGD